MTKTEGVVDITSGDDGTTYRVTLDEAPTAALNLVQHAAEAWDGMFERGTGSAAAGGTLRIPMTAGLRRGWVEAEVTTESPSAGSGTTVVARVLEEHLSTDRASVGVLMSALFGAAITLVAPMIRTLWELVPIGILLAIGGWFFVVARLRNSGVEEFLEVVAGEAPLLPGDEGDDILEDDAGDDADEAGEPNRGA